MQFKKGKGERGCGRWGPWGLVFFNQHSSVGYLILPPQKKEKKKGGQTPSCTPCPSRSTLRVSFSTKRFFTFKEVEKRREDKLMTIVAIKNLTPRNS